MPAVRIAPKEAYENVKAGQALLVCGYEDEEKFRAMRLEMAVSFSEFEKMLPSLPKDREIVFYCAWMKEHTAAGQAVKYNRLGYPNAKALLDGVEGWKKAGYRVL